MPLLALIKTKPLLCSLVGIGTVAAPAATIYYTAGLADSVPKADPISSYSPPTTKNLDTKSKTSVQDRSPSICTPNFFPGLKIGTTKIKGNDGTIADDNVEKDKLIGCAVMKLDYTDSTNFSFYAEMAAKTDSLGWVVQIYIQTAHTNISGETTSHKFTYTIFWLTRDSATRMWKVDSAIYFSPTDTEPKQTTISFPNKPIMDKGNVAKGASSQGSWFGTWEESSEGDDSKRIFEDLKIEYNDNKSNLYVGEPLVTVSEGDEPCNYNFDTTMDPDGVSYVNGKWQDTGGSQISTVCCRYHQQLKDKRGKWIWHDNPETFCDQLKSEVEKNASNDEAKRRKLMNYCFSYG